MTQINKAELKRQAQFELSRRNFYYYCKTKYPEFYREDRVYLKILCNTLQLFYERKPIKGKVYNKMMVNLPPRHGKTFTIKNFCEWVFGKNSKEMIFDISYNEKLSTKFARSVRDSIDAEKLQEEVDIYNDFFPSTKIKKGDASVSNWSLEGGYNSFLASSPHATITGMGCSIGIIDDLIKSKYEAFNQNILDGHYEFYADTFLSRLEEGSLQLLVMTRWSDGDLCGQVLKEDRDSWYVLSMPAVLNKELKSMLCPELLSYDSYIDKTKYMSKEIASANYGQRPLSKEGRLYSGFRDDEEVPRPDKFERIIAYVDTADLGSDLLCGIVAGIYKGRAWILDVYVSDKGMEITEPAVALMLFQNNVNIAFIESNNGGRGFARNVEKLLWNKHATRKIKISWFHQSKNKIARILSNASSVMTSVIFPKNWHSHWKIFYEELSTYQRKGKNKHDDCPDALTGIIEKMDDSGSKTFVYGGD